MAALTIDRASSEQLQQASIPYTTIPNFLIYCAQIGLKPRDTAVFNYLYSQNSEKFRTLNPKAIANALAIGVSTVRRALAALVKAGFATYQRFADGRTSWKVALPQFLSQVVDLKPHSQKPHVGKPHVDFSNVLTRNNLEQEIKEQQTAVVVEAEIVNDVIQLPEQINVPTVKQQMSKLTLDIQAKVLAAFTMMLAGGNVKNPIGYVLGLTKKAQSGEFSPVVDNHVDNQQAINQLPVKEKLRQICARSRDRIIADLNLQGFIHVNGYGNFTRYDLEPYLK